MGDIRNVTAIKLDGSFDHEAIAKELRAVEESRWTPASMIVNGEAEENATIDWPRLAIRSIGGDMFRADPAGPSPLDYADSPIRSQLPALDAALQRIPARLRSVRVNSLGPGAMSPLHDDVKHSVRWGNARLHIVVTTNDAATMTIDDVVHQPGVGELWYGSFNKPHVVANNGTEPRLHIVIDACLSPELVELFPAEYHDSIREHGQFDKPTYIGDHDITASRLATLRLPSQFFFFCQPASALHTDPCDMPANIVIDDDYPHIAVPGKTYGLIPVGRDEYRFAGWTSERTISLSRIGADAALVVLSCTEGGEQRQRPITAARLTPLGEKRRPAPAAPHAGAGAS